MNIPDHNRIPVVIGPTASGKSALAMALADRFDGDVINMDSMQIYRDLRILSARPSKADEEKVPHRLYGVLDASIVCSAAMWLDLVQPEIDDCLSKGRLPILCGGTGLYLKALMEGLAPIPPIPDDVRDNIRSRMAAQGPAVLHADLAACDPAMASRLFPGDSQRIARALEVVTATGRSLADWQHDAASPLPYRPIIVTVLPPRDLLYAGIDSRFKAMVDNGALEEVERLVSRALQPTVPAMKALGVPELAASLRDEMTLEDAIVQAATKSRRYAKRQITWCNRQIISDFTLIEKYSKSLNADLFSFIENACLTR